MGAEEELKAAKQKLSDAAKAYAATPVAQTWTAICDAAVEFSKHATLPPSLHRVPFGRDKGKSLDELDDKSVTWLLGVVFENVNDPSKSNYKRKNEILLEAVQAEAKRRGL